jgi:hypothetical protein
VSQVIGSLDPQALFAGIDWGGSFHQLCVVDAAGTVVVQQRVAHDVEGLNQLVTRMRSLPRLPRVAIERSEGILVEHLHDHGLPVFCVSPKISARARERYRLASTKSDAFDAFVLADTLRHEHLHWRPLATPSPLLAELRAVSRDRERLIEVQHAVESRLRAVLEAYHPAPLHLFSSLDRDITLAFITDYPTPAEAGRIGADRMRRFCRRHGYSGRSGSATPPTTGYATPSTGGGSSQPFLAYDVEIRRLLCSTNAIESLNARSRRAVTAKGHFPSEQAALKTLYLVTRSLDPKGTGQARWITRWKPALVSSPR